MKARNVWAVALIALAILAGVLVTLQLATRSDGAVAPHIAAEHLTVPQADFIADVRTEDSRLAIDEPRLIHAGAAICHDLYGVLQGRIEGKQALASVVDRIAWASHGARPTASQARQIQAWSKTLCSGATS